MKKDTDMGTRAPRRGYVLLVAAMTSTALLACVGLVTDIGYLEYYRRKAQIAADAGALGGIREIQVGRKATAEQAARDDATANGFTNGVNGATVIYNSPPSSGAYNGDTKSLEVIVAKDVPSTFLRILNLTSSTVRARSVGGMGASAYCIVSLDPTVSSALNVWGNATVYSPNCGVMVDSSSSTAMTIGNSACLTASSIDVTGNYTSGSCTPVTTQSSGVQTGVPPLDDPLAYLDPPCTGAACSTCNYTNYKANKSETLNPGVYCGGIAVNGSGNTITFNAGTYILYGGGLKVSGGNTLIGNGITFYNTGTTSGANAFSEVQMTGNVRITWSAPTTGSYAGILFYQDRNFGIYSSQGNQISGDEYSTIDGVFYLPAGKITYTGNSSPNGYTSIIADQIVFTGSNKLYNNYSSLPDGSPVKAFGIVE